MKEEEERGRGEHRSSDISSELETRRSEVVVHTDKKSYEPQHKWP